MTPRCLCSGGSPYWPLATFPYPSPEPVPSAGGGAHRLLIPVVCPPSPLPGLVVCPPSPCLAYPLPPCTPFPRSVVPMEDRPCFTALC